METVIPPIIFSNEYVVLANHSLDDFKNSRPIAPCSDRYGLHRGRFAAYRFVCPFGTPLAALWVLDTIGSALLFGVVMILRSSCSPQFGIVVSETNEAL